MEFFPPLSPFAEGIVCTGPRVVFGRKMSGGQPRGLVAGMTGCFGFVRMQKLGLRTGEGVLVLVASEGKPSVFCLCSLTPLEE